MPEALPELIPLALLLVAFGLVYVVRKFVQALFGPIIAAVGHIPGLGGAISGALHSIESAISRALGSAEQAIDHLIGAGWHLLAKQADWLWHTVKTHAALLEQLALGIVPLRIGIHALRHGLTDLTRGNHSIGGRIKTLEREFVGIEHGVRSFERDFGKVLHKDVLPHLTTLDKEIGHLEGVVIPDLRALANGAEAEVSTLQKWISQHIPLPGTLAFAGAVAWALTKLGLDWIKCNSARNVFNKRGCGLWNDLDALLGAAFIAAEIATLDELIGVAQSVTEDITKGVEALLKV